MNEDNQEYIYELVSYNIRKYRKEKKMTQAKLAEYANLSHEFVRRIESTKGKKKFTLATIYKIATVLEIDVYKFFIDDRN